MTVRKRILVADDETSILRSTELLLNDLGFDVLTTSDPEQIVPILVKEKPDLLLQDVRMPGLDLDRLLERVRGQPETRGIPVLLFSASMDLAAIQERVGASGYLEKPFRPAQIIQAIQGLTEG